MDKIKTSFKQINAYLKQLKQEHNCSQANTYELMQHIKQKRKRRNYINAVIERDALQRMQKWDEEGQTPQSVTTQPAQYRESLLVFEFL